MIQTASDGTRKLRLRTADGEAIESVLIPNRRSKGEPELESDPDEAGEPGEASEASERGLTQCISSQIGCAVDCRFCATASLGFRRNLDTWEIVDQVERARVLLADEARERGARWPQRITNVVYMGMGEPLHNFNQVERSIAILTDERGDPIAGRRITVSTSGLVPAIQRFAREGLGLEVGLAISLNATTDAIRDQVMPINQRWNIAELLAALREVPTSRRRHLTFEYVLLGDVNDSNADAERLVELLREFHCHVNVIPFNPHPGAPFRRPTPEAILAFQNECKRLGMATYLRTPRGDDIDAACGQLANRSNAEALVTLRVRPPVLDGGRAVGRADHGMTSASTWAAAHASSTRTSSAAVAGRSTRRRSLRTGALTAAKWASSSSRLAQVATRSSP